MDIFIVQINLADPGQNPEWDNCYAYQDQEQALAKIDWNKAMYGDEVEYRIDVRPLYTKD